MKNSWENAREKLNSLAKTRGFCADLARRLDVHPTQVLKYLNGKITPGIDQVDRFAAALGMQAWELIRPTNALPTAQKKLTAIEHLEKAIELLKEQQSINNMHNYDD